ncbi:hypothetical protein [Oryzicola mucosus]|uniref:Polysaccharide chain length determinant N-terminal domain-containing protein n=1 Tax=Oryzicola mucosus TaxID=2767425 RepID=A0A8J6PQA0_9HYPH|nr:hypothetical protein [Oryzicola mucosus]MBD0416692.1 hypothetical protein [Oryzicola mucosus]
MSNVLSSHQSLQTVSLAARWRPIAAFVLLSCLAAYGLGTQLPERYRAEARILIDGLDTDRGVAAVEQSIAGQIGLILSDESLKRAADRLDLETRGEFGGGEAGWLDSWKIRFGLVPDPERMSAEARTLAAMRDRLTVRRADGRLIAIEFSAEDPDVAAAVPNALADGFETLRQNDDSVGRLPVSRVISRATAPAEPYYPSLLRIVGMTFILSVLIACVVALIAAAIFRHRRVFQPSMQSISLIGMPADTPRNLFSEADEPQARTVGAIKEKPRSVYGGVPLGIDVETAAERLIAGGTARAVFLSPEGDDAAASSVLVAREIADAGLRVLLLDLTASAAASSPMLDRRSHPGITDLLASEAQFSEVIHADHYSACHVIPKGNADPVRAMRAADRLPIILHSLITAYDIVVVECGPADPSGVHRVVGESTTILVSHIEAGEAVARALKNMAAHGYTDVTLVRPERAMQRWNEGRSVA